MNVHSLSNGPSFTRQSTSRRLVRPRCGPGAAGTGSAPPQIAKLSEARRARTTHTTRFLKCSCSFLRLNQKFVGRFLFHAVFLCCEDAAERCFRLISLGVIIVFEHWMRGRVESEREKFS